MTSLLSGIKQNLNDVGYFINVASLNGQVNAYNGNDAAPQFSCATWAFAKAGAATSFLSSAVATGGSLLLKDMGKTVVSSLRTFRKVQVVRANNLTVSTFGVGGGVGSGAVGAGLGEDFLTGYIELGFEGNGTPAPVAHFGR
jgi:hypothetical protein